MSHRLLPFLLIASLLACPAEEADEAPDPPPGTPVVIEPVIPAPVVPLARIGSTNLRSIEPVAALAWTPHGRIVSGTRTRLDLWNADTGEPRAVLREAGPRTTAMAASVDWLAVGTDAGRIELWAAPLEVDAAGPARVLGAQAQPLTEGLAPSVIGPIGGSNAGGLDTIYDLAWARDGGWLASAHGGWMDPTGHRFTEPVGPCGLCIWSPAGERLATPIPGPSRDRIRALAVSPDGSLLASGADSGRIVLWSTEDWSVVGEKRLSHPASSLRFAGDLLVTHRGDRAMVRSVPGLAAVREVGPAGRTEVSTRHDAMLVVAGETVAVHRLSDGGRIHSHDEPVDRFWATAMAPDGGAVALAGMQGRIRIWDLEAQAWRHPGHLSEPVGALAFSPDGDRLTTRNGPWIRHFDTAGWQQTGSYDVRRPWVWDVAFSRDGASMAVSYGYDGVDLVDLADGATARVAPGASDSVHSVRFSPTGDRLAATDGARTRVWSLPDPGRPERHLEEGMTQEVVPFGQGRLAIGSGTDASGILLRGPEGDVRVPDLRWWGMQITVDGATLVAHDAQGGIVVVDAVTGEVRARFGQGDEERAGLALSRDDGRVASGTVTGAVEVWDLATGERLHRLEGHEGPVSALDFSPDGRWLASGSVDTMVRVWPLR